MKKLLFVFAALACCACGAKKGNFDASGRFEATEVIVSAEVAGKLVSFAVTEGDTLAQGETVGCIDTVQLSLRIRQLAASIRGTDSRQSDIAKQIAVTQQQISTQYVEQHRIEQLLKADAANRKQLDDINAQIALLERQLSAQRSTLESGNRGLSEDARALSVQIEQLEDQIVKSRISSPIRGTVLEKYAEAGEMAAAGRPLFKVADVEYLFLRAYVTADQLTRLKLGQAVTVYSDFGAKERRSYPGKITWISDQAEFTPKTIQTRNERADLVYALKVAVRNDGYLKIGMYGELTFQ